MAVTAIGLIAAFGLGSGAGIWLFVLGVIILFVGVVLDRLNDARRSLDAAKRAAERMKLQDR